MTLIPMGNSFGVLIPRPYLKALGADYNTEFKIMTDGVQLILIPIKEK